MKEIKIKFCGFAKDFSEEGNDFVRILRKRYKVVFSDSPDYVFYSNFNYDFLKYDCTRIFFTSECLVPDFNLCDYAIGFDYLDFGDRYLRYPLYKVFQYRESLLRALGSKADGERKQFCAFVCSNDNGMKERKEIFDLLSLYKKVDSGGRYLNNVGGPVTDKYEFLCKHKFCIAFENCVQEGYSTEKIVDAFAAGTIPIYYGNPKIGLEFNTKAFINCHDFNSFREVVDRIKAIDQDDTLYEHIISEPVANDAGLLDESVLENFLYNIFDQDKEHSRRRPYNTYIREQEYLKRFIMRLFYVYFLPMKKIRGFLRRLKNHAL